MINPFIWCPFCGERDHLKPLIQDANFVRCGQCGADGPCPGGVTGWNTRAPTPPDPWQSIATAPRGGTSVMLRVTDTFTNETWVDVGRWGGRRWLDPRNRQINPDADVEITHWMPLPDTSV